MLTVIIILLTIIIFYIVIILILISECEIIGDKIEKYELVIKDLHKEIDILLKKCIN